MADDAEIKFKAIAEIVKKVVECYEKHEKINITNLKKKISSKYKLKNVPRLVDIISALPESHKDKLGNLLKAKPVRTASGIAVVAGISNPPLFSLINSNVQASQMSAHQHDREHLHLLPRRYLTHN
jgi:hypothetical protein